MVKVSFIVALTVFHGISHRRSITHIICDLLTSAFSGPLICATLNARVLLYTRQTEALVLADLHVLCANIETRMLFSVFALLYETTTMRAVTVCSFHRRLSMMCRRRRANRPR